MPFQSLTFSEMKLRWLRVRRGALLYIAGDRGANDKAERLGCWQER